MIVSSEHYQKIKSYYWDEEKQTHIELDYAWDPKATYWKLFYSIYGWAYRDAFIISFDKKDLVETVSNALQRAFEAGVVHTRRNIQIALGVL